MTQKHNSPPGNGNGSGSKNYGHENWGDLADLYGGYGGHTSGPSSPHVGTGSSSSSSSSSSAGKGTTTYYPSYSSMKSCSHHGDPIKVGPYTIFAGADRDLKSKDMIGYDLIISLNGRMPSMAFGERYTLWNLEMQDYGGVPAGWKELIEQVIEELEKGLKILCYCMGGHGRTGTFLASLIALLEPETADPIAAARERHCKNAVESGKQTDAIFALLGKPVPEEYEKECYKSSSVTYYGGSSGTGYSQWDVQSALNHFDALLREANLWNQPKGRDEYILHKKSDSSEMFMQVKSKTEVRLYDGKQMDVTMKGDEIYTWLGLPIPPKGEYVVDTNTIKKEKKRKGPSHHMVQTDKGIEVFPILDGEEDTLLIPDSADLNLTDMSRALAELGRGSWSACKELVEHLMSLVDEPRFDKAYKHGGDNAAVTSLSRQLDVILKERAQPWFCTPDDVEDALKALGREAKSYDEVLSIFTAIDQFDIEHAAIMGGPEAGKAEMEKQVKTEIFVQMEDDEEEVASWQLPDTNNMQEALVRIGRQDIADDREILEVLLTKMDVTRLARLSGKGAAAYDDDVAAQVSKILELAGTTSNG